MRINGILLLYHHLPADDASTIMENVGAFGAHSRFPVTSINTAFGFPETLATIEFEVLVLHYSLFQTTGYRFDGGFADYLAQSRGSFKIAFFQDENHYCRQRFDFINRFRIDMVYTLLKEPDFQAVYGKYTPGVKLISHLPGYVSDRLIDAAKQFTKSDAERSIDIGYRARPLAAYMGRGAQEKHQIGLEFRRRAASSGLKLDIALDEQNRIYGEAWYRFLADCRAVLGVESGVSVFDLEDAVRVEWERLINEKPSIGFDEIHERVLSGWENNIHYRTISPRHFEAAALRVCQILFEGDYSGIMRPMVHYIPLKKDFSNLDHVIAMFKNDVWRAELTDNAYRDLIASGKHSYGNFIEGFDRVLTKSGFEPAQLSAQAVQRLATVSKQAARLRFRGVTKAKVYNLVMGTRSVALLASPILKAIKHLKRAITGARPSD